jgi:hypothetical protein
MLVKITPEMFRNNNFVNKDGQKILFRGIHQHVALGKYDFSRVNQIVEKDG